MNHLDAALAARAFDLRRGVRRRTVRHRRLVSNPLAVVAWQLGGEPFAVAALGWGDAHAAPHRAVVGEPRNRDLLFAALLPFARWFNQRFEAHGADRERFRDGEDAFEVARTAPQVLVPNRATVELLGRLGRRLAYLPTDGPRAAPVELVRLGRHLRFLWENAAVPGQQLVVALTDLVNDHWAVPLSAIEAESLAALDAVIAPPGGGCGLAAAVEAELRPVGPAPDAEDEQRLAELVERFNADRAGRTDPEVVRRLLPPVVDHYRPLLRRAWDVLWRCRDREAPLTEAPSVGRRWDDDRVAYTRHVDWLARGGLRRTRHTPRQAASVLMRLEEAGRLLEAEEACDDPLVMAAAILADRAVRGTVTAVDPDHTEPGARRAVVRPLVTLRSPDPCMIPVGRDLWWSVQADGREYAVEDVRPTPDGWAEVVLKRMTSSGKAALPAVGTEACFSVFSTARRWLGRLPEETPWTHQGAGTVPEPLDGGAPAVGG